MSQDGLREAQTERSGSGLVRRTLTGEFARFLAVGGAATASQYAVLLVAVEAAGVGAIPASAVGYAMGALVSYLMNRNWTFGGSAPHRQATPRFAGMILLGFLANAALMRVLIGPAHAHYLVAQVCATGVVLLMNYLLAKFWVFRRSDPSARGRFNARTRAGR